MRRPLSNPWLLLIVPWLLAAVPSSPPPPLELTDDELALARDGTIAVRIDPGSETGGGATGIVDVDATPAQAMAALMDLEARVSEIGSLKSVERYLDEPGRVGAKWTLKVLGITVVFHILYERDDAAGWVRYTLDESRENDLVMVEGAYQVYGVEGGRTRIVYRSETDSGRSVPQWVKRWLATGSLKEQLGGIAARAEAAQAR